MKLDYKYRSDWFIIYLIGNIMMVFVVPTIVVSAARTRDAAAALWIMLVWIILFTAGLILLDRVPVSICADETSVTIKVMFRTRVIKYSNIKAMEITREVRNPQIRGDQRYYAEILRIGLYLGDTVELQKKLDIDYDSLTEHPEKLKSQFDSSKFNELKSYIESKMK